MLTVDPERPDGDQIRRAAAVLKRGGLVAFPTETVYGLGADAYNAEAVARIYRVKGRPPSDPIIVHVLGTADLQAVAASLPPIATTLAEAFWPGPLTLVVPRAPRIPAVISGGLDSVAVRAPSHPVSRALLAAAGRPVAAPSANAFGHTSPTTADHVIADLGDKIDMVIDAGHTPVGIESTVLDVRRMPPVVLRPGGVTMGELGRVVAGVVLAEPEKRSERPRSPGLLARHYAPQAALILVTGRDADVRQAVVLAAGLLEDKAIGLILSDEDVAALPPLPSNIEVRSLGRSTDRAAVAHQLYDALRKLDAAGVAVIIARDFGTRGLALAVHDRLTRAAVGRQVRVLPQNPAAAAREIVARAT